MTEFKNGDKVIHTDFGEGSFIGNDPNYCRYAYVLFNARSVCVPISSLTKGKEKHTIYVNVNTDGTFYLYKSKEDAKSYFDDGRIAIPIEIEF